ncbi:MAG TPA: recombination-associated protein RdgC [Rubrivivax sp.]|nr:recombination-associated protein RdgC [Rubrivivax sp.]
MFKNALVYRIEHWTPPALGDIEERLAREPFVECGATQPESAGWIAPRGQQHGALAESVGGQLVLELCTETKSVPGGVVKAQLQARLDQIEQETGRRPRGKALRELKEALVHSLLPRAFPKRSGTRVWVDAEAGVVWVGVANARRADAVITRLVEQLGGGLKLAQVQTAVSPARAMAQWLLDQEAPSGFSIDRDCELKQPDSEKATVRYARHTLDIDEVGEHVRQGKLPTQLALTWAGRVSFVLTEGLALKRIELLDVVLEGAGVDASSRGSRDEGFDADVAIATGELRRMLPALIEALGGFEQRQAAAAPAAAAGADAGAAGAGAPRHPSAAG